MFSVCGMLLVTSLSLVTFSIRRNFRILGKDSYCISLIALLVWVLDLNISIIGALG